MGWGAAAKIAEATNWFGLFSRPVSFNPAPNLVHEGIEKQDGTHSNEDPIKIPSSLLRNL